MEKEVVRRAQSFWDNPDGGEGSKLGALILHPLLLEKERPAWL
jgi:hypothetical protein